MILNETMIEHCIEHGIIEVQPAPRRIQLQPSSLDMRVDHYFKKPLPNSEENGIKYLDMNKPVEYEDIYFNDTIFLQPQEVVLGTTIERIKLPSGLSASVEGRSSFGRNGATVHVTAGYIDPGFNGKITLEMANLNPFPVAFNVGDRVCQLVFQTMVHCAQKPYGHPDLGSSYQGQDTVKGSCFHKKQEKK